MDWRVNATRLAIVAIVAGCVCLVLTNLADYPTPALVAKLFASSGFIALAVSTGALLTRYGNWVLAALCLSWAGDAFLELETRRYFLPGLGSFLLAHICYVIAFATCRVQWSTVGLAAIAVGVASGIAMYWLSPYVGATMTLPVWAYVTVISVMVTLAWGVRGAGGTWFIPIGATLFYLSDLSVAAGQFVKPDFPNYVWGLPLYYAGQTLLALSAASSLQAQVSSTVPDRSTPETGHP